jgi:hypothetical protein
MDEGLPSKLCGRGLSAADLETIRRQVREAVPPLRAEVARRVCRALSWSDAVGRPKLMSCRVALLRLHRAGLIELPAPCRGNGNGRGLLRQRVDRPLPGAQLRYLIGWERGVLGAIGFGAAAWKVAVRDRWIGWEAATREQHLQRVVNNARFLILPWVRVANLASKVLALAARQVPDEFGERYGVRPVLLETFVEAGRFAGTCYLGETTGRGKLDRYKRRALPVKDVYVYPLEKGFRQALGVGP